MRFVIPDGSRRLTLDGRPAQGSLELTGAMLQAFEVQVPRGAPQIRIDLTGATGDLDLYAFVGGVQSDPYLAEYHSVGGGTAEWLVLNSAEDATAAYGIVVLSWLDEVPVDFTIQAKTGADPPADLLGYPTIPVPPAGIGRSLISTVEVLDDFGGGSACLLTPDGWLITNHHVIANSWEDDRLVRIALSLDHSLAPRELFLARIVDVRKDADLALLKIESGLYGQDLPRDMRLPYFSVESDSGLSIGQDIRIIGYPSIGALGTRSTITLTRGLVSGFEQRGFGRVIKTDGEINSGNSGGAAVTESGLLVGFPTWVISEGGGQLAYVSPVGAVPEDWWQRMGLGLP